MEAHVLNPELKVEDWPLNIIEAYERPRGPYTIDNADKMLDEESVELYNGWLVWQAMTDIDERRLAANIQLILDLIGRDSDFGQALPDESECYLKNGDVIKPDISLISKERLQDGLVRKGPNKRLLIEGGPELVVELRSPSNRRTEERVKRKLYFANKVKTVWDIDPRIEEIWVYNADTPLKPRHLTRQDEIDFEPYLAGWRFKVADLFNRDLKARAAAGQVADRWEYKARVEGIAEGEAKGRLEGIVEERLKGIANMIEIKFGVTPSTEITAELAEYSLVELEGLVASLKASPDYEAWLGSFPT